MTSILMGINHICNPYIVNIQVRDKIYIDLINLFAATAVWGIIDRVVNVLV